MALQVAHGTFVIPVGENVTYDIVVNGIAFQPTAIILFSLFQAESHSKGIALGYCDAALHQAGKGSMYGYFSGSNLNQGAWSDQHAFVPVRNAFFNNFVDPGQIVSIQSDGFTIRFSIGSIDWTVGTVVRWFAFGGAGVEAHVGTWQSTGVGLKTISGLAFRPKVVIAQQHPGVSGLQNGIGAGRPDLYVACDCDGKQYSSWVYSAESAPANAFSQQRADYFIHRDVGPGAVAQMQGFTNDGFILDQSVSNDGLNYYSYLALGGAVSANIGSFLQPTTNGAQTVPLLMASPKFVLVSSNNKPPSDAIERNAYLTLFMGIAGAGYGLYDVVRDAIGNPPWSSYGEDLKIQLAIATGVLSPAGTGLAEVISLGSEAINLDWTQCDGTARELFYVAIGDIGSGADADCGSNVPSFCAEVTCPCLPPEIGAIQ